MKSYKVILAQAKSTNSTWSSYHGGEGGRVKFMGAKKLSVDGEELKPCISSALIKVLKVNKRSKYEALNDYDPKNELEHFNF